MNRFYLIPPENDRRLICARFCDLKLGIDIF
jgi:hypothetical protein